MKRYLILMLLWIGFFSYLLYPARFADAATSTFGDDALLFGKTVTYYNAATSSFTDSSDSTRAKLWERNNSYSITGSLVPNAYVDRAYIRGYWSNGWNDGSKASVNVSVTLTYNDSTTETQTITVDSTAGYRDLYYDFAGSAAGKVVKSYTAYTSRNDMFIASEFDLKRAAYSPANPTDFVIHNIAATGSGTSATITWDAVNSQYFGGYRVYNDSTLISTQTTNSYTVYSLKAGQTYVFRVAAYDSYQKQYDKYSVMYAVPEPDTKPPGLPTAVTVTPDRYSSVVKFTKPSDTDYYGVYVYLGDQQLNNSPSIGDSYQINSLKPSTTYSVSLQAVDTSGNKSEKTSPVSFTTLELKSPPAAITNLSVSSMNGGALLTWSPVTGANSYKLYQNNALLTSGTSTTYRTRSLVNGSTYSYYVIATNDAGDSPKSNVVIANPSVNKATDVTLGVSLGDIATATTTWFAGIWLILAFSISIPLAFYVANRTKGLFTG